MWAQETHGKEGWQKYKRGRDWGERGRERERERENEVKR
jgi:hypothetical protein